MKFYIIIFITLLATAVCDEKFKRWQLDFKKYYKTNEEIDVAMADFAKADNKIALHNAKFEKGEVHYKLGHNQFSDWTPEMFESILTMDKIKKPSINKAIGNWTVPNDWTPGLLDLTVGTIPVKNQGSCGSCWAFSAAGVIEYNLYKRFNHDYFEVSEQNFLDCARRDGCSGGWMHEAFNYYKVKGVNYESIYPYVAKETTCAYVDTSKNDGKGIAYYFAPEWYTVPPQNERALAYAVYTFGWISVCLNAKALQLYSSGIITASKCSMGPNHAVILVGYGSDEKTGMPYWKIKNSWGSRWGEHGYLRLERDKNACDIANPYDYYSVHLGKS